MTQKKQVWFGVGGEGGGEEEGGEEEEEEGGGGGNSDEVSCVRKEKRQEAWKSREQKSWKSTFFMSGVREMHGTSPLVMLTWSGTPGSKSILSTVQERLPSYIKLGLQSRHKRHAILSKVPSSHNLRPWQLIWHWLVPSPDLFTNSGLFPFLLLPCSSLSSSSYPRLLSFILFLLLFLLLLHFLLLLPFSPSSSSSSSSPCFQKHIKGVAQIHLPQVFSIEMNPRLAPGQCTQREMCEVECVRTCTWLSRAQARRLQMRLHVGGGHWFPD